ncbi:MAG TPA: Ricin and poly(3-hydroxybutyrate) depolymerase fusion [Polyangiaceae bacterium]|nr:Ricin and poly(3-hydroxybutyrate) depolymerase fusion [Polyangiaceae bacterium]
MKTSSNESAAVASLLACLALVLAACSSSGASGGGSGGAPSGGAPGSGGASLGNGGSARASGGTSSAYGGASSGGVANLGQGGTVGAGGKAGNMGGRGGATTAGEGGALAASGGKSNGGGASTTGGNASGGSVSGSSGAAGAGGATGSPGCGASDALKSGRATLDVSGSSREYILKLPDNYDPNHPYKLIFAFHARGGNASQVAGGSNNDYYGLFSRSGGSAIFVSPEGLDAGWRNENGRDIAFVKAMLSAFNAKLCIDQRRIFSTGFSFGGMMSDAIGCAMADVFRAIAPMSGGVPNADHPYSGCDQVNMHPIAVWMAHGDNDTVVPLADGKAALDIFLKRSQCQTQTSPVSPSPCVAYQGCQADYPITLCQFSGGHNVPSFAAEGIWNFFKQF